MCYSRSCHILQTPTTLPHSHRFVVQRTLLMLYNNSLEVFIMYCQSSVHFTLNVISHLSCSLICISEIYTACTYHCLTCTRGSMNGMDISPFGDSICSVGDDGLIQTFTPDAKASSIISMCGMVRTCMGRYDLIVTSPTIHRLFSAGFFNSLLFYHYYIFSIDLLVPALTPSRFRFWRFRLVPRACNQ